MAAERSDSAYGTDVVEKLRAIVQDAHLHLLVGAGAPSALFAPLGDVEAALTELAARSNSPESELARASIQALFFDRVLWPNVQLVRYPGPQAKAVISSYQRLARTLNRLLLLRRNVTLTKRVSLFTTNNDLAFETSFDGLGLELQDGFTGRFAPRFDSGSFGSVRFRQSPRYGNQFELPTFDLVKLHGSVGWYWVDASGPGIGEIGFDTSLYALRRAKESLDVVRAGLVRIPDPKSIDVDALIQECAVAEKPPGLEDFLRRYDELVIVHPEKTKFSKTVLTETYYELIRLFANELERENSLLVVMGFSFRDEHLRKIVLRAARSNPTLQVYVACYTRDDEGWYRSLMPDEVVPNGNVAYLVPPDDATKLSLDEVIDRFLLPLLDPIARDDLAAEHRNA